MQAAELFYVFINIVSLCGIRIRGTGMMPDLDVGPSLCHELTLPVRYLLNPTSKSKYFLEHILKIPF
jgi:hypothetical protein